MFDLNTAQNEKACGGHIHKNSFKLYTIIIFDGVRY
jgi:hypothetical protein